MRCGAAILSALPLIVWSYTVPALAEPGAEARQAAMEAVMKQARQHLQSSVPSHRSSKGRRDAMRHAMAQARRRMRRATGYRLLWPPRVPARLAFVDLGERSGAMEIAMDMARQRIQQGGGQQSRFDSTVFQEHLTLRNTGASLYDPRLFSFSLAGDFGLSQERLSTDGGRASRSGTLLGYETFASLLEEQATSLNLFASRGQSLFSRELAGRSDLLTEHRGATLFAKRLPLPSTVTFRQEHQEEESRSGDVVARRDDLRNVLTYEGRRGWTDQEMSVRYELNDLNAEVTPSLDFQSHELSLNYGADLGPELNRHVDSQHRYFTRTGATDLKILTIQEALRVDHSERLWSDYRYHLLSTESLGQTSTTHTGTVNVQHKLYESLTTTGGGDVLVNTLPGGEKNVLRSRLDVAYTKRLPLQGRLNAGLGGRLEYEDDRFEGSESFVPQETHVVATPLSLPITLSNVFVITSSLVVTKTVLGPLPPGCLMPTGPPVPLIAGRDYTLLPIGNATQLVPQPCTGAVPGMNPGDTIAVDYRFTVFPAVTFLTESWRMDLSADYRWLRPYAAHSRLDQDLLAGVEDGLLDWQQSDVLGLELRGDNLRVHANLLGEMGRFRSARIGYDQLRSTQVVSHVLRPDVTISLIADEALMDFATPSHQTRTFSGGATVTYAPRPNMLVEMSASQRRRADTLLPSERTAQASLKWRWLLRKLEMHHLLEWFNWKRGGTETRELRWFVRMTRQF